MTSYSSVQEYLTSIFPNEDVRNYVVRTIADTIHSENPLKKMYIYKGDGANGKSEFLDFIKKVYGDNNVDKITHNILLETNNPRYYSYINEKKIAIMAEPEINQQINSFALKNLLSNNPITFYGNTSTFYGKGTYTFPGIIIMNCNNIPDSKWDEYDNFKKINVIPFETCFKSTNKKLNLDNLIEEFRIYIKNIYDQTMDMTPPEIIQKETLKYIKI